jgi:hypothetical protein
LQVDAAHLLACVFFLLWLFHAHCGY